MTTDLNFVTNKQSLSTMMRDGVMVIWWMEKEESDLDLEDQKLEKKEFFERNLIREIRIGRITAGLLSF